MIVAHLPLLLAQAAPATPAAPDMTSFLIPMVAMFVIMYVLIIRPQKQQQTKLATLVSGLKVGDKVVTQGGIHAVVATLREGSTISLRIADGVKIEVDKSAIASVAGATTGAAAKPSLAKA